MYFLLNYFSWFGNTYGFLAINPKCFGKGAWFYCYGLFYLLFILSSESYFGLNKELSCSNDFLNLDYAISHMDERLKIKVSKVGV